ncbi:MAG: GtrA family protein [Rhodoferax sp.]|nr:GtrA family protein [Rhodoferax sp.]
MPTLQQFIRYGSVGALATVVHYLLLVLAVERADWAPWWASGLGAVVGAQVAYLGNRWLTFAHAGSARVSWPRFQLTALAEAVVGMVSVAFAVWLGWHYLWAQVLATLFSLVLTFAINRSWTFR